MAKMKSVLKNVTEFVVKFVSKALIKKAPKIANDTEAAEILREIGDWQVQLLKGDADLAAAILALQEDWGKKSTILQEQLAVSLTRLRDYGELIGLLNAESESQTKQLATGRIAFNYVPRRVKIKNEKELITVLQGISTLDPLNQLVISPPPPPPKIDRQAILAESALISRLNEVFPDGQVSIVKSLRFTAFPTAQPDLLDGFKIVGEVKDVPAE
jgi:phage host-nuclease inhibitor protein Gam